MRYLHAISPAEMFIASGSYQNADRKTIQQWTIHQLPDQAWMIRVDHIPQNILIEAWRSPQRTLERVDVRTLNRPIQRISYLLENALIEYGHTDGQATRIHKTLKLTTPLLALPSVIGISLALDEWHITRPTLTTLDLSALELITAQIKAREWAKSVIQFNQHGIPQRYQDHAGGILTLTDFAATPTFNLSINLALKENL